MKKIITSDITNEQWKEVDRIRDWWLNVQSVEQYSDAVMRKSAFMILDKIRTTRPLVICVSSVTETKYYSEALSRLLNTGGQLQDQFHDQLHLQLGNQLYSHLHDQLGNHLHDQLDSQLDSQLQEQLYDQLGNQLDSQLDSQLHDQLGNHLHDHLHDQLDSQLDSQLQEQFHDQLHLQLGSQLYSHLHDQLHDQLYDQLRDQLHSRGRNKINFYHCGEWWRAWAGWYEGGKILGVQYDDDIYDDFRRFCMHCPVWMWDENAIYILRNPSEIKWQDSVLHNEHGPSVKYSDGLTLWSIEGVAVDEQIVMRPESQTLEQIQKEGNEEVKRIRIERYGWDKYLTGINAEVIDERRNDIENTHEALIRYDDNYVLVCACPSTGKKFFLETEKVGSCESAQQWLHAGASIDTLIPATRVIGRS